MAVELDLTEDKARLIWCRLARSRKLMIKGIKDQNMATMGTAWGWLDATLTELAASAPSSVEPTGNETDKP